jgi:hypothetical protein
VDKHNNLSSDRGWINTRHLNRIAIKKSFIEYPKHTKETRAKSWTQLMKTITLGRTELEWERERDRRMNLKGYRTTKYWWQHLNHILIVLFSIGHDVDSRLNIHCNSFTWYKTVVQRMLAKQERYQLIDSIVSCMIILKSRIPLSSLHSRSNEHEKGNEMSIGSLWKSRKESRKHW